MNIKIMDPDKDKVIIELNYKRKEREFTKNYWRRRGFLKVSAELVKYDDFWDLILSFASIVEIRYRLRQEYFIIYVLSWKLPVIEEGEKIPEYQLEITEEEE